MSRRLAPEEEALWARVAGTVRPLKGKSRLALKAPAPKPIAPKLPAVEAPPRPSPQALAAPIDRSTLDGGWDKRLRSGKLDPDLTLDLHGYSRDHAYSLLADRIESAASAGARVLLVITGKGAPAADRFEERPRGVIRASLPHWLETPALRPYVAALRPAHPRHGGSGAWYVILRRRRP